MKALIINDKSYSWRFASVYGSLSARWGRDTDICSYTRAVVVGVLRWLAILAASCGVAMMMADTLAWLTASAVMGAWLYPDLPTQVVLVVMGVTTGFGALCLAAGSVHDAIQAKHRFQEPSGIVLAYRSFRDKYCIPVTVVSSKQNQ